MTRSLLDAQYAAARARLRPEVLRYVEQGAGEQVTAREAECAWDAVRLVPRVLRDVREVDTATTVLGATVRTPVGVAPTTLQRAAHAEGEVATARACAAAGAVMVVSSNAGSTFADIGSTGATWWLQLYLPADREDAEALVEAAVAAGASALVLTVDTPLVATKPDEDGRSVWECVEPGWVGANFEDGVVRVSRDGEGQALRVKARDLSVDDLTRLAARWELPVVVKGVLHPLDARDCVLAGAAAVWVSNHGGRQLDQAVATADALPAVVEAVRAASPTAEVYVDGGVRTPTHVAAALAAGAGAVFLGRPAVWALAAGGEQGVGDLLGAFTDGLRERLTLLGATSPAAVAGLDCVVAR